MLQKSFEEAPIVFRADPLTRNQIEKFAQATCSEHYADSPLTLPTILRAAEFKWLERLKIDMRELLHTDQEYEFVDGLREGDVPVVYTRITERRERRGMTFVVLESEVRCDERVAVVARSSFVIRSSSEGPSA
ncbi:MaoC family dehydratase N-terminal domain-containing protein [bacterium]|nr:MaoC family dehydratase N-terminal domain-containing protein [bacterium]